VFFKYLSRELSKRKKQTSLIASGLAVAIALVVVVSSVSGGIKSAQAEALRGLYGIGTDISVSKESTPGEPGQRFEIGSGDGQTEGQTRTFSKSRLEVARGSGTITQAELDAINAVNGITASVATLKLNSVTFNGELPTFTQQSTNGQASGSGTDGTSTEMQTRPEPPTGGSDGAGGSAFDVTSFSVEGVSVSTAEVGPLAATLVDEGRGFSSEDAEANVALLDAGYATSAEIAVGDSITIAETEFEVIGLISSTATTATTPSNVYIPISVAQTLSSNDGVYSNLYVAADNAANLDAIKAEIEAAAPEAKVSTASDLASTVTGSLATASALVNDMGGWLSAIVLLAAFATAILFTTSGVNRRIREFGTLKAIGWRSSRVVKQIVGESLVSGLIGGVFGIALGFAGVWAVNSFAPTLSATVASATRGFGGPGGMAPPGMESAADSGVSFALNAVVDPAIIALALGFAIIGGLLAGAFGGLRAARLSPATALRSFE
jgi:ABC-type lipoprotein release transport system permease subunit